MNSAFEFYHVLKRIRYKCRQHASFFFIFKSLLCIKSLLCKMLILDLVFSIFNMKLLGSSLKRREQVFINNCGEEEKPKQTTNWEKSTYLESCVYIYHFEYVGSHNFSVTFWRGTLVAVQLNTHVY